MEKNTDNLINSIYGRENNSFASKKTQQIK